MKKGFEIGSEIGFFQSFAHIWIKLIQAPSSSSDSEQQDKRNQKVKSELEKLALLTNKASDQVGGPFNKTKIDLTCNLTPKIKKAAITKTFISLNKESGKVTKAKAGAG